MFKEFIAKLFLLCYNYTKNSSKVLKKKLKANYYNKTIFVIDTFLFLKNDNIQISV